MPHYNREQDVMRQDSFSDAGFEKHRKKTRKEQFPEKMNTIIRWKELIAAVAPFYPKPEGVDRRPIGIDFGCEPVPDETTICRFRHVMEKYNLAISSVIW